MTTVDFPEVEVEENEVVVTIKGTNPPDRFPDLQ